MKRLSLLGALLLWLVGCANFIPTEPPKVNLVSLKRLQPQGLEQPFLIGLRVSNPNKKPLPLAGLGYKLSLNGRELVRGFREQLPSIEPHADTYIEIEARLNLINAVLELGEILGSRDGQLHYQLDADLELSGHLPDIHLSKQGLINLE